MKMIASAGEIEQRLETLAEQINTDYAGLTLDIVCLINSASFFCADLMRKLTVPSRLHFLGFSHYETSNVTGEVRITQDVNEPLYDCHVLVLEGVVVSGRTPRYILDLLSHRLPASLALCALARKPLQQAVELPLNYVGFELNDEIAVGFGVGKGMSKVSPALVHDAVL